MKITKYLIFVSSILICLFLAGCATKKIDFIAGESLYEIGDKNIEITFIEKNYNKFDKEKFKQHVNDKLSEHKNIDAKIKNIKLYGENIRVTLSFKESEDVDNVLNTDLFNDTLKTFLDNDDIDYDQIKDKNILYNVLTGEEITEDELHKYEEYRLVRLNCNNSKVKVNGEIKFASKQGDLIKKDTIYFKDYDTYYLLYKPSTGINNWVLWTLLVLIVAYAVFLSMKWQSNKKTSIDCYYCGKKNDYDAIYCKICGNKINDTNEKQE